MFVADEWSVKEGFGSALGPDWSAGVPMLGTQQVSQYSPLLYHCLLLMSTFNARAAQPKPRRWFTLPLSGQSWKTVPQYGTIPRERHQQMGKSIEPSYKICNYQRISSVTKMLKDQGLTSLADRTRDLRLALLCKIIQGEVAMLADCKHKQLNNQIITPV